MQIHVQLAKQTKAIKVEYTTVESRKLLVSFPGSPGRAKRRGMSEYQAHDRKTPFCIVPRPSIVPGMECSQSLAVTLSYPLAPLPF